MIIKETPKIKAIKITHNPGVEVIFITLILGVFFLENPGVRVKKKFSSCVVKVILYHIAERPFSKLIGYLPINFENVFFNPILDFL